ncbi:MAG: 4Fe-4S dicluster domain-containing protein, partial [Candidatus Bathyarchaeota archaeon]|nr:4Fe-4S dicluster domain-containing protein [Candidatus Bathyarchaeota archaeon]
ITRVEKVMPTFRDALLQVTVQSGYAGLYPPTYINIISGVSSTADIEYKRVYGAQGAQEVYVIIYDGGRLKASKHCLLKEQLRCIKCGRCQVSCPIWIVSGNFWGGKVYGGPMGVGWTAITEGVENAEPLAWFCLLCNACKEVCPVKVNSAEISRKIRMQSLEKGIVPTKIKEILEKIYRHGNPFGLSKTKRGE